MIVLCDGCDKGCHSFCMNPPVPSPPEGDWYCSACLTGNPQVFASREGPQMSMSAFSKAADEFYTRYTTEEGNAEVGGWGEGGYVYVWVPHNVPTHSNNTRNTHPSHPSQATLPDLEHEFWQLVTAGDVPVEVHSAFDLDTRTVGSGFTLPTARAGDTKTHPWNLNNLPRVKGYGVVCSTGCLCMGVCIWVCVCRCVCEGLFIGVVCIQGGVLKGLYARVHIHTPPPIHHNTPPLQYTTITTPHHHCTPPSGHSYDGWTSR